ncbi:MAG: EAL domain-containing protein [Idiomarina sp.]|nr:EAL domain-containing protein [Idiomarina sp.]
MNPELDAERFRRLSEELISDDLHVRHVAVAPNLVIKHIYPLAGNEGAIGLDYRTTPDQYASIAAAINAQDIVINGPLELVQGGQAMIARLPVFSEEGQLWGIISQVIDHRSLLEDAGLFGTDASTSQRLQFSLRGANGTGLSGPVIFGNPMIWEQQPVTASVNLPVGEWVLAAAPPRGEWEPPMYSYYWLWSLGTLLSLAISLLIFNLLTSYRRLKHAFATISHQARFDLLTGLPNRASFMHYLRDQIEHCQRKQGKFAILFIDLDHFKEINDSLGHEAGDELLLEAGHRIQSSLRADDIVARFGGDEFVVLLRDLADPLDAEFLADKILGKLQPQFVVAGHDVAIQGSIGIAVFPEDGVNPSDLIKHADLAMYAAKAAGRGTSYFYNDSLRNEAEAHIQLHHEIQRGLQANQFSVYYQPVIDAATRSLISVEALVRWNHPEYGVISPVHFVPVAEKSGTIRELGAFVLAQACRDYHAFEAAGLPTRISINRSPREFNDPKASQHWLDQIDSAQVPRESIIFEITESLLMPDRERQHQMLRKLSDTGVRLSIDDFGTGYSSVTYLRRFPVSQIKIDRAFLHGLPENQQQTALVKALIEMAQALNLEVVAEGVETETQANALTAMGCDLLQGYYFSPPIPANELIAWHAKFAKSKAPNTR